MSSAWRISPASQESPNPQVNTVERAIGISLKGLRLKTCFRAHDSCSCHAIPVSGSVAPPASFPMPISVSQNRVKAR
jgi:hypothetical protein